MSDGREHASHRPPLRRALRTHRSGASSRPCSRSSGASIRTSSPSPAISPSGRGAGSSARPGPSSTRCPVRSWWCPAITTCRSTTWRGASSIRSATTGDTSRRTCGRCTPTRSSSAVGLNTTRSFTVKDGTIRPPDLRHARDALVARVRTAVKIVVAHHPFEYPEDASTRWQKAAVIRALEALAGAGADVFLTGHLHLSYTGPHRRTLSHRRPNRGHRRGRHRHVDPAGVAKRTASTCCTSNARRSWWSAGSGSRPRPSSSSSTRRRSIARRGGWSGRTPEPPPVDVRNAIRESPKTQATDPSG